MAADNDDLVDQIYQAMHGTLSWQNWIDGLNARFDGVKFALWGHDLKANSNLGMVHSGYDKAYMQQWIDYYSRVNAWAPGLAQAPVGVAQTAEQLLDRQSLLTTEYYHDWVRPQEDIATGVGITFFSDANRFFGLTANVRLKDEEQRNPELKTMMTRIAPHLSRAFDAARRMPKPGNAEDLENFVARLPIAAVALNSKGHLCYMNALAQQFIDDWAEPQISSNGALVFADPQADDLLARGIQAIAFGTMRLLPHRVSLKLGKGSASWRMSLVPSPLAAGEKRFALDDQMRPVAFLFMEASAGQIKQRLADELGKRFGLSPAETALALALYGGETLGEIAARKGLSVHTVRNQLRTTFAKTHTHRQHQLVRLISDLLGEKHD